MTACAHRLLDAPDGLPCTRETHDGNGHTYAASWSADAHDASEQRAEARRS